MMFETSEAAPAEAQTPAVVVAPPAKAETHASVVTPSASPATLPGPFHMAGSLFVVIAVIFAAAFLLRRVQGLRGAGQGGVIIKGGLQVGARERVLLIEAQGRRVLVGVAPGSVRALHVFEAAEQASVPEMLPVQPAAFAEKLKSLLKVES
ncbi:MAG TPA: flagellar biosynthetic protein FliO [Nevskiaceae bacterium]|nr:flagellar biosynthetic protein FliO [Nevskiaceae bacterium]